MARSPGNADRLMLATAKKLVCKSGCTGLRIRDVVNQAGVNLGMFHYHFKSKENFTRQILQEFYEEFFVRLISASRDGHDTITQLRNTLLAAARFVKEHHAFYLGLIKDVLNDDAQVVKFIGRNFPRHAAVFRDLVQRCQKEKSIAPIPFPVVASFLMTALNFPTLIGFVMLKERRRFNQTNRGAILKAAESVLSEDAITQRLDIALKGLRP